jgi:hypothetical protein
MKEMNQAEGIALQTKVVASGFGISYSREVMQTKSST